MRRAGVARKTLYDNFEGKEEVFLAAFDAAVEEVMRRIEEVCAGVDGGWEERVEAGLGAFLAFVAEEPAQARMCMVEAMSATPAATRRYEDAVQGFVELTRRHVPRSDQLPETIEETLVGGVAWIVHQKIRRHEAEAAMDRCPSLPSSARALPRSGGSGAGACKRVRPRAGRLQRAVERLPRGRHGLSPKFVAQNQRERLVAALAESLYERGYEETTVAMIGKRAGVSKSDFYKRFESKDACFLAAYDDVVERIREELRVACAARDDWAAGVLDALAALLAFVAAEPARARLVLVEGLRAGKGVYARYQEALRSFVPFLRDGAPVPADGRVPPRRPTRRSSAASPRCLRAACSPAGSSRSTSSCRRLGSSL